MAEHITITTQALTDAPPSVTRYQQFVGEAMAALDQILAVIPKLDQAEASDRKVAQVRLGVPEAFIETVVSAVEQLPELAAAKKLDPAEARDKLQYIEAFRPLYDKLFTVTRKIRYALLFLKDSLAGDTLQIYRIAKQHASDARSPLMAAHVANMKRDLARKQPTRAVREERKIAKLMDAVAELQQTKEVQKTA